jgi:beta-ribofuranosylaminobenzene 5'-phosphate synthase
VTVTVETGARLHFGFQNLALAHDRLYGGIGVGLDEPTVRLSVSIADQVCCGDAAVRPYVESAVDTLGVGGAEVTVDERFDRHVGLGSGTQLALASLAGIARAHGIESKTRARAPDLGRGGRSGVGVATFENGGLVVDAGHRTEQFTTRPPDTGSWSVPETLVQRSLPDDWRFVLVVPDVSKGKSGSTEQASMASVVEQADPGTADQIATVLTRQLLPAVAEEDVEAFGESVARIGRLNGAWYADEQGGVYRPPAGTLITALQEDRAILGAGQSSWGPTVYGVTDAARASGARAAAMSALDRVDVDGSVRVVSPAHSGATIE